MILMHKDEKLFLGWLEPNWMLSFWKASSAFWVCWQTNVPLLKQVPKHWRFLPQTSSIFNVWKYIWFCRKHPWAESKDGNQEGLRLKRSIRSDPEVLSLNSAGISILWTEFVEHLWSTVHQHCTADSLCSELSLHFRTLLLWLTSSLTA